MNIQQLLLVCLLVPSVSGLVAYKFLSSIKLKNPKNQRSLDLLIGTLCVLTFIFPMVGGMVGIFVLKPGSPSVPWFLASLTFCAGFCWLRVCESDKVMKDRERRTVSVELKQTTLDHLKEVQRQTGTSVSEQISRAVEQSITQNQTPE